MRDWYADNIAISMWSTDVVCTATCFAAMARGPIAEIGAYVGGGRSPSGVALSSEDSASSQWRRR